MRRDAKMIISINADGHNARSIAELMNSFCLLNETGEQYTEKEIETILKESLNEH